MLNRSILEITGPDRRKFLQGLVTNDVNKATEKNLIYSAMLNAQGRFLYDFFIFEIGEKLILDCDTLRRDEIFQKLNFYKLRAEVEIRKNEEMGIGYQLPVASCQSPLDGYSFPDPRNPKLGHRIYTTALQLATYDLRLTTYDFTRISLKIPESEQDLTYEKSFILEFGFDDLNAVDYQKGCYVGQELTARTHHTGQIRKKIFHVTISQQSPSLERGSEDLRSCILEPKTAEILDANASRMTNLLVQKNTEISCEGKSVGLVLSSIFHNSELHALALLKLPEAGDLKNLEVENKKIFIID